MEPAPLSRTPVGHRSASVSGNRAFCSRAIGPNTAFPGNPQQDIFSPQSYARADTRRRHRRHECQVKLVPLLHTRAPTRHHGPIGTCLTIHSKVPRPAPSGSAAIRTTSTVSSRRTIPRSKPAPRERERASFPAFSVISGSLRVWECSQRVGQGDALHWRRANARLAHLSDGRRVEFVWNDRRTAYWISAR